MVALESAGHLGAVPRRVNDGYSKGMPTMRVGRHHLPMGSVRQIVDKAYQKNRVLSIARLAFFRTNLLPDWQWEEKSLRILYISPC